jgi:hypothetical protein
LTAEVYSVEGVLRIMMSDYEKPLNLGTEEMVSMK